MAKLNKVLVNETEYVLEDASAVHSSDIVQIMGDSETAVMSQSATSKLFEKFGVLNLGTIIQGTVSLTNPGGVSASNVSIRTSADAPLYLGTDAPYRVYLEPGWVYSIVEYDDESFSNGDQYIDKTSIGSFLPRKPYAVIRFNKYDSDGNILEITPDDFKNSVIFVKDVNEDAAVLEKLGVLNLGGIIQGAVKTNGGISPSEYSIRTSAYTPLYLGKNVMYNVYLEEGWTYSIITFGTTDFTDRDEYIMKSTNPRFASKTDYAVIRFNKYDSEGNAVAITPDDFKNSVIFVKDDYTTKESLGVLNLGQLRNYAVNVKTGKLSPTTKSLITPILYLGKGVRYDVRLAPNWQYSIIPYDSIDSLPYGNDVLRSISNEYVSKKDYARIRFSYFDPLLGEYAEITFDDFNRDNGATFIKNAAEGSYKSDMPENIGVLNAILNAKQAREILYTPIAPLPAFKGDGYLPANKEISGMLYSSTRVEYRFVPNCVSFYTFMSALKNPNALVYTEELIGVSDTSRAYYGMVCSTFVDYALGLKPLYTTELYPEIDGMELIEDQSAYGLKLCDVLLQKGHVRMVTDIKRNYRGRIVDIEVMEATKPTVSTSHYTPETFETQILQASRPHKIYRYKYLYKVKHTPNVIVPVEDESGLGEITYNSNLMGRLGDKFNIRVGEDVVLDVLDVESYTQYKVTKDGTELTTATIPTDNVITLSGLAYGKYAVCLTDGTTDSTAVEFIVVDSSVSVTKTGDTTCKVAFSSANATPVWFGWRTEDDYTTDQINELTNEDVTAGYKVATHESGTRTVYVMFETEYGTIMGEKAVVTI